MFDINTINKRYFDIKLTVTDDSNKIHNVHLEIGPPKIKTLKKIMNVAKAQNENSMDDLADAIRMVLNKNKTGYKVPEKFIDELDYDQMSEILSAYFEWLNKNKNDPN